MQYHRMLIVIKKIINDDLKIWILVPNEDIGDEQWLNWKIKNYWIIDFCGAYLFK